MCAAGLLGIWYWKKSSRRIDCLWADTNGIQKITLNVLETNTNAIKLYQKLGFEIEGILKKDKLLSDGKLYNTIMMGRVKN